MTMTATLDELGRSLVTQERSYERRVGEAKAVVAELRRTRSEVEELQERSECLDEAITVINSYADSRQKALQERIETLITYGLRTIFGEDLSFHIKQAERAKRMEADFVVVSKLGDQVVETPVLDARGGGVAAVAGFLLRLIILLLRKDVRPVLFLDETFAQLSAEYEPALAEFMKELTQKTSAQIILVTHSTAYDDVADASYRFSLHDGVTQVSQVG